jgi:hypothetical protein
VPLGLHLRNRFGEEAAAFLEKRDLHLVGDTYELFIREFLKAKEDAESALLRKANGHFGPDPEAEKYASAAVLKPNGGKVLALSTFDAYAEDAGLAPKTRSAWRSKIRDLIAFVGHDDLARLTRKEVLAWKENGSRSGCAIRSASWTRRFSRITGGGTASHRWRARSTCTWTFRTLSRAM